MNAPAPQTKSRLKTPRVIGVLVLLLMLVGAALYWLQMNGAGRVAPLAPALATPLPPVAPRVPPATADDLAPLAERIAAIEQQVAPLGSRLSAIEATLGEINDAMQAMNTRFDKAVTAAAAPKEVVAPKKHNPRTHTKRASAKRSAATKVSRAALPALVAADQWGREPSATLRRADGALSFHRVGDTVGRARITAIDPDAQAIQLRIDGKFSTLKVAR